MKIVATKIPGLLIVSSGLNLSDAETKLADAPRNEWRLAEALTAGTSSGLAPMSLDSGGIMDVGQMIRRNSTPT